LGRKKKVSQKAEGSGKKNQNAKELQPGIGAVAISAGELAKQENA